MDKTWLGIGCGVAAGALWGLVFLAPELAREFTPLQLAAGRYLAYGLFAALLVVPRWRTLSATLGRAEWWALVWLSLLGNILYYVLLASAVQLGGMAMTSLVIGFLPVAVTIIGSRDHDAVPFRKLLPSLLLGAAGILCIGWQSLGGDGTGLRVAEVTGLFCAVGALISWTTYAVSNSRWLARLHHVSAHDWSLLTGLVTGAQALLLAIPAFVAGPLLMGGDSHDVGGWLHFVAVASGVAILASIVGNALWNRMSRLLPLTLVGQMILFETLFALLYGFLWEQRLPTVIECAAIAFVIGSVLASASAHRPKPSTPNSEASDAEGKPVSA
ncbi:drug/metabolite transporter (DMT)-like permease [Azospirillum agricola]|uniref:DMT family transporter n=1 Tax=Azospirillum agricola TaxID=1720247 RepID=UPI001AE98625|nr:DMT family transporter [Azospirillum agricola]MBP2227179.1 drug/metabolite transporter (DMT)-like permease [Azospirillum agricola]